MTQPAKNRQARVWSMNTDRREGFLSGLKIEERVQAFWESRAGTSLRQGIPVLVLCLFGGQGKLTGGAMPFAPALLAGAMMRGRAVPYAAAGCPLGVLPVLHAEVGLDPGLVAAVAVEVLQHEAGVLQALGVDVVQGDGALGQGRGHHGVSQDVLGEHGAARPHKGDLRHSAFLL